MPPKSNAMKSNDSIVRKISKIVDPYMKFDINVGEEESYTLYFKHYTHIDVEKENELMKAIEDLKVGTVRTCRIQGVGRFTVVELYKRLYNDYLCFLTSNSNLEKIDEIYQQLEEKVPKEFLGWAEFLQHK